MAEYIERDEIRGAYEKLTRSYVNDDPYIADWRFDEMIESLPASDVAPVRHGRWLPQILLGTRVWDCSECKTIGSPQWKRCPVCEAKMDEEEKE